MSDQLPTLAHAGWGRRLLALLIDWISAVLVVIGFIGIGGYLEDPSAGLYILGVFFLQVVLLTLLVGGSFGQTLLGIRVLRVEGRRVDPLRALFRTALICLVIPPLVFESSSGRGLHDIWTGTGAYRRVPAG